MDDEQALHKKFGIDLFNYTWDLMDKPSRTRLEDDEMMHAAHASRYHWSKAGTPINLARGEWQISRVYTVLGRSEPARYHAQRCLDICLEHGYGDFDLAYAYEALARASKVSGDAASLAKYTALARAAAENIADAGDREHFDEDLASL